MKKKLFLSSICLLFITACEDKQKYEAAVLAQMQTEQDVKDYNIDPEDMTECIVNVTSDNMPGAFPLDPERLTAYQNYTKMLKMSSATDKKKAFDELRNTFSDPIQLRDAHSNYTESMMECINIFIQRAEEDAEE